MVNQNKEDVNFAKSVSESFALQPKPPGLKFEELSIGEAAFTIYGDGRIKISSQLTPDKAAKTAWDVFVGMVCEHNKIVAEREALRSELNSVRSKVLQEVASWYDSKGWLLDEMEVPDAIRALKSTNKGENQ
ncbi:hypothetical protein [Phaeobacter italicus]|uniref:hypothetical protein n=1 Tax=Phaeobacter italicus TaxID=481446 RepID=UPI002FDCB37D